MRNYFFACISILGLILISMIACTPRPIGKVAGNIPISKYELFKVEPVTDDTEKNFDFDVAGELTRQIILKLQGKGYKVINDPKAKKGVLLIRSTLISYAPGNAFKRWLAPGLGKTQATVRAVLIDKDSGEIISDIVFAEAVQGGGLYSIGSHKLILAAIAEGLVNQIEQDMK